MGAKVSAVVLDASVALSWCFDDQADEVGDRLLGELADRVALVPSLFSLELANAVLVGERRKRISVAQGEAFFRRLEALPIEVDELTSARAAREILSLARTHGLSTYDAAYLELALRHQAALYTRDRELAAAARRLGLLTPMQGGADSA